MLALLKQNPLLKNTPLACLVSGAVIILLLPVAGTLNAATQSMDTSTAAQVNVHFLGMFLMIATLHSAIVSARYVGVRTRVTELEQSLPVTFRMAVQHRMMALWIALVAPLLVACGIIAMVKGVGSGPSGLVATGARLLLYLSTAAIILFAWRPKAMTLGATEAIGLCAIAVLAVMVPTLQPGTWSLYSHPIILVGGLFWINHRLPNEMPAEDESTEPQASHEAGDPMWSRFMSPLQWILLRGTLLRPSLLVLYGMASLLMLFPSSGNETMAIWFPVLVVFQGTTTGLVLLNGLGSLPVSRSRILPYVVLPSLILLLLTYSTLSAASPKHHSFEMLSAEVQLDGSAEETLDNVHEYSTHVKVPAQLWAWTESEKPTTITAPWGETTTPVQHPLYSGSLTSVYNPYDVNDRNTVRFAAWQVSRALSKTYEVDLTPEQVHARWFPEEELDSTLEDARLHSLGALDTPEMVAVQPPNRPGSGALLAVLVWFLTALSALRSNIPGRTRGAWLRQIWTKWTLLVVLFIAFFGFSIFRTYDRVLGPIISAKVQGSIDSALGSSPLAWGALILAAIGLSYAVLRIKIQRLEVPKLPKNGWTKKELSIF